MLDMLRHRTTEASDSYDNTAAIQVVKKNQISFINRQSSIENQVCWEAPAQESVPVSCHPRAQKRRFIQRLKPALVTQRPSLMTET